jgi:hypothetical protein
MSLRQCACAHGHVGRLANADERRGSRRARTFNGVVAIRVKSRIGEVTVGVNERRHPQKSRVRAALKRGVHP